MLNWSVQRDFVLGDALISIEVSDGKLRLAMHGFDYFDDIDRIQLTILDNDGHEVLSFFSENPSTLCEDFPLDEGNFFVKLKIKYSKSKKDFSFLCEFPVTVTIPNNAASIHEINKNKKLPLNNLIKAASKFRIDRMVTDVTGNYNAIYIIFSLLFLFIGLSFYQSNYALANRLLEIAYSIFALGLSAQIILRIKTVRMIGRRFKEKIVGKKGI